MDDVTVIENEYGMFYEQGRSSGYFDISDSEFRECASKLLSESRTSILIRLKSELCSIYSHACIKLMYDIARRVLDTLLRIGNGSIDDNCVEIMLIYCMHHYYYEGIRLLLANVTNAKTVASRVYYCSRTIATVRMLEADGVVLAVLDKNRTVSVYVHCNYNVMEYLLKRKLISLDLIHALLEEIRNGPSTNVEGLLESYIMDDV